MNFSEYISLHKGKRVAVCGVGVSNMPLIRLLRARGISVEARDKKDAAAMGEQAAELEGLGVKLIGGDSYLENLTADIIYRSPGIRPDAGELTKAHANGAIITSEMEAFFDICPCKIIAVTGSDGKTTTSTLISETLKADGKKVWLGGNIGAPLLDKTPDMAAEDLVVVELSSFQLMTMKKPADIAVVTNISPNHLDWHSSFEEYIDAKKNIFRGQSAKQKLVLNAVNDITRGFANEACGNVSNFSLEGKVGRGAWFDGNSVFVTNGNETRKILDVSDIKIPGRHNIDNYMAVISALNGLVSDEAVFKVAREFGGVEHRLEFVRELNGVKFYNCSISSSPSRTIADLKTFGEKVVLIAGGYDKKLPFEPLAEVLPAHVRKMVLIGATSDLIRTAAERVEGFPPIIQAESFEQAIYLAYEAAEGRGIVLLSPACASFDLFPNFSVRGEVFKEIVQNL